MKPVVDFEECLRDSPRFREVLENNEADIDQLENKLEKLIKLCSGMVDSGKTYLNSKSLFINGVWELSGYFKDDKFMVSTLNKLIQALTEMLKYQSILIDQAQRAICKNLSNYVKSDIKTVKETRKCFDKISDDMDITLTRNSQVPRSKPIECEDYKNTVTAVSSCFQHTGLDYIYQISSLQSRKNHEISDTLLSLMHAYSTYFHQGSDLFQDVDPFLKELAGNLTDMRTETSYLEKQMESRHQLVNTFKESSIMSVPEWRQRQGVVQEGYLFKRTSNAFKTWNRRWFMILNNQLVYRRRCKDDTITVMEEDLKLCSVKPCNEIDRRHCFEVLSPSKSHILQADSQEQYQHWMTSILTGINDAIQTISLQKEENHESSQPSSFELHLPMETGDSSSTNSSNVSSSTNDLAVPIGPPPPKPLRVVSTLLSVSGNDICCDCKVEHPQWASINLGVTLCIECSGIHRSLGVHVSKVRSLTLDAWEPELLRVMLELGNTVVNKIYEGHIDKDVPRATPDSSREEREAWIKAKYVDKKFVVLLTQGTNHNNNKVMNFDRKIVRKWSVRKVNRRKKMLKSKNADKSISSGNSNGDPVQLESTESSTTSNASSDVLVIGNSLIPETSINAESLDLDSSDESPDTGVEDSATEESTISEDIEKLHPDLLLYRAASVHNIPVMSQALANGANPNWINEDDDNQRPLHQAIRSGSLVACEFLMLNGSKFNIADKNERTPLHVATELGQTGQVCLLLKRGIDQRTKDVDGKDALAIAVNKANADIVTLLRLGRLNEEMRDLDFTNPGDETFNEVVKDFTQMASNNPEKLKRLPSVS